MPDSDIAPREVFGSLLTLVICLAMLVFLFFIVVPDCADLAVTSGGTETCETGSGLYLFGAAFSLIAVYVGYTLTRMLFPARFG